MLVCQGLQNWVCQLGYWKVAFWNQKLKIQTILAMIRTQVMFSLFLFLVFPIFF